MVEKCDKNVKFKITKFIGYDQRHRQYNLFMIKIVLGLQQFPFTGNKKWVLYFVCQLFLFSLHNMTYKCAQLLCVKKIVWTILSFVFYREIGRTLFLRQCWCEKARMTSKLNEFVIQSVLYTHNVVSTSIGRYNVGTTSYER